MQQVFALCLLHRDLMFTSPHTQVRCLLLMSTASDRHWVRKLGYKAKICTLFLLTSIKEVGI